MKWLLGLAALVASTGAGQAASVAEWRGDIDRIVADIRLKHPEPFAKTGELAFLRAAAALKAAVPSLTEEQRLVGAMRLVALVGDGHTQLEPAAAAFDSWYPLRIYEFEDGYFVTGAIRPLAELAGAEILAIAGRPVEQAAAAARDIVGADNALDRKERLYVLSSAAAMRGLGLAGGDGALHIRARLASGRVVERRIEPLKSRDDIPTAGASFDWRFFPEMMGPPVAPFEEWVSAFRGLTYAELRAGDPARPAHFIRRRGSNGFALDGRDAYYIQSNGVGGFEDKSFAELFRGWIAEIERQKPRRLIIDIRYNAGGDGSTIPPVIHEFIARQKSPPWRELYLLTGRRTFSAGVMMLDWFADHVPLTIVGEPAGAHFNHYGDATPTEYPAAGLRLYVSTLRHQLGQSNELDEFTPVDTPAPFTFADYRAGRDPAVDAILSGEEMRSIQIIARTDGGAAARAAYQKRKADFSGVPWWKPPTEFVLRGACDGLIEVGRLADAVETCALSTEIHPDDWHSWFSLGQAQEAAGEDAAALASYRRVLEIDPLNPNKSMIDALLAAAGE